MCLASMAEFIDEYNTAASVRKYTKATAGHGISYLFEHDYGKVYRDVLETYIPQSKRQAGIRLFEFGCGGGMNLLHLVVLAERLGIAVACAYGTDFSETMIAAANCEAQKHLTPEQHAKVRFTVARNERLIDDVTKGSGIDKDALVGSFDLILGVNTIRYCHRLKSEDHCVGAIFELLGEGGLCIIIDMNNRFPAFRSRVSDRLTKDRASYYLPTLDQYAAPFSLAGFEILRKENFCWIPHSAGPTLTTVMSAVTPALNVVAPSRAMRSLVISRKTSPRP